MPNSGSLISSTPSVEDAAYYYHADHLGSSSLITGADGSTVQHLEYVPYGEVFIDERQASNSWTTPYKFSGKERDEETGLLYFGARYQDSKYGIWYSVDPLAEKKPWMTAYNYCSNNPLNRIDPDGRDDYGLDTNTGRLSLVKKTEDKKDFVLSGTFSKNGEFSESNKSNSIIQISKGVLNSEDKKQDLSKHGFVTMGGNQTDGINLMQFVSFQTGVELDGKGFDTKGGEHELIVGNWDANNTKGAKSTNFNQEGTVTFDIHTHPSDNKSNLGYGIASDRDLDRTAKYPAYYILSQRNGLTQYFPAKGRTKTDANGTTVYPALNSLPSSLKNHLRNQTK